VDGAPRTLNFFAHTPISERVELGLTVVHDEIGNVEKSNNITADFAYVIPTGENTNLSFGAKAGINTFDANLSGLNLNDPNDPAFENISEVFPVFGVGAFWFGDKHYIGVSAPNLLTSEYLDNSQSLRNRGSEEIHYYLTGGYVFDLGENVRLKPSTMIRGVEGAPLSVDVNANVLLYERLEAGVGYRFDETVTGLINFRVTPGLRIGYAYDYPTYDLSNDGSHEIMLLFDLDLFGLKKGYDKSPRFF
ncbi:MAG: type IX secretion system membrane protein PorP/SprF, partial [Gramella sp.]|nr:type IX secretion system membrane protein PorP/SprF [Christiangramia sp.]